MELKTIEEILDYAISNEEKAAAMYHELAENVDRPGMREAFLHFAKEEEGHKARLLKIKEGEIPAVSEEKDTIGSQVQAVCQRYQHAPQDWPALRAELAVELADVEQHLARREEQFRTEMQQIEAEAVAGLLP